METVWIVCNKPSHELPRTSPAVNLDPPQADDAPGAVIGPFQDVIAARGFAKADPRMWIYLIRKIGTDITPDERERAIAPDDWSAQGQMILGAVWIKPKKSKFGDRVGPFAYETVAMQFANADPLLSRSVQFELRHNIKPDDLMDASTPEEWSKYRRNEVEAPAGANPVSPRAPSRSQDLPRASGLRRVLAIVVDWFAWGIVASAVQIVVPDYGALYALILFLLLDVVLTAFVGQSPGRYVARIRVVRSADGGTPGLGAALLRTGLVVISGWLGLFIYLLALRYIGQAPKRMWWDAAAGTEIVSALAA